MWQIWLIIAGICLIAEIITVGFLIFWFAIAALITMIVSLFTDNLTIQMSVFVISSIALILATKPLVNKFLKLENSIKTNVYSIIGKHGIVTEDIDSISNSGQIKVAGETWTAIGQNDMNIPKGTQIEILEIKGVKVIVAPIKTLIN